MRALLLNFLLICCCCFPAFAGSTTFQFGLPNAGKTSAGIYLNDGTLVRTLWSNKSLPAGTNLGVWDGLDDNGVAMPAGNYIVKYILHNTSYTWQGTIGNTSTNQTGTTVHHGYSQFSSMAIAGSKMYVAKGYNEGSSLWTGMNTSNPNSVTVSSEIDYTRSFGLSATDGTYVYFANTGNGFIGSWPTFTVAVKVSDDSKVTFPNGTNVSAGGQPTWNVIDQESGAANSPTGMAVQPSGPYLFIAHGGLNQVRVYNKTTGALVRTQTVLDPIALATTTDNDLWSISLENGSHVARRHHVDANGNLTTGALVTGLTDPIELAVSPDNNTLLIADAGTSQQVKAFSNVATGTPTSLWTLGLAGGYNATNGPDVTNTKFCFGKPAPATDPGSRRSYLAFQSDGSFWLGDPINQRNLHFSASRTYLGQVAYLGVNYSSTVCVGDPTRVFAVGWLEFAVPTYSAAAKNDWTLVKNWAAGLPADFFDNPISDGLSTVIKMSNGRYYATASNKTTGKREVLELTTTGLRRTNVSMDADWTLNTDGSWRRITATETKSSFYRRTFSGFDGSGNPQWNAETLLASTLMASTDPVGNSGGRGFLGARFPSTSTGMFLVSDGQTGNKYSYRLGALNEGGTKWLWRTAPVGLYYDGTGVIGNGQYPVNNSFTQDRNIILGCHGEFYTPPSLATGQANQFMHYWDNGLFIGEFGTDLDLLNGKITPNGVAATRAGNSFSPAFVKVGSDYYLWHNDEASSGGMHRWKINNPDITDLYSVMALPAAGGTGTGLTGQYFNGANQDTLKLTRIDPTVDFTWQWTGSPDTASGVSADNFSVRWSGLVQPLYSQAYTFYTRTDDRVRLWVNGTKIIDNWVDHTSTEDTSTPITLVAGHKYNIVMEFYDNTGNAVASLQWASASQAKEVIPVNQLYPSDSIAINCGGPAVGRFQADPLLGLLGPGFVITTANTVDTSGVVNPAPMSVYQDGRQAYHHYSFSGLSPLTNYKIRLHTAEIDPSRSNRHFGVKINGVLTSPLVDMTGPSNKAAVREYVVTVDRTGAFNMSFEYGPDWPITSAIEVERDTSDSATNPQFASEGSGKGIKGEYFTGTNFNTLVKTQVDPQVNFDFTETLPPTSVGPNNFTVRWTGKVQTAEAGSHKFILRDEAGSRLWVNGVLIIDKWNDASGYHEASVTLAASTQYDIKLEYLHTTTNPGHISLNWQRPSGVIEVIPTHQLYPAP